MLRAAKGDSTQTPFTNPIWPFSEKGEKPYNDIQTVLRETIGAAMAFVEEMGITFLVARKNHVEAEMPITDKIRQPHGFVHGGATLTLLESVASMGAELSTDLSRQRPFGFDVHVRHLKSGKQGALHATADLVRETTSECTGNVTQCWSVVARDDVGDVVSEGEVTTKIVSLARLAEKECARNAARAQKVPNCCV